MTLFSNDAAQRPDRSTYKNELTVYENHNSTGLYYYNNIQVDCNINKLIIIITA